MKVHNNVHPVTPLLPVKAGSQTEQEAALQALLDLGLLAFLAEGYSSLEQELQGTNDPTLRASLLQQIQSVQDQYNKVLALFHVGKDGTVTFDFDDGKETVTITDPTASALITQMEGNSDITKYGAWWNSQTNSPALAVFNYLNNANSPYNFASDTDPFTQEAAIFFMLSCRNAPGDLGGVIQSFLERGDNGGALPNQFVLAATICAILANNPFFNADAINACIEVPSKDPDFVAFQDFFLSLYNDGQGLPAFKGQENEWLSYESIFFPWTYTPPTEKGYFGANAVGLSDKFRNETKAFFRERAPELLKKEPIR